MVMVVESFLVLFLIHEFCFNISLLGKYNVASHNPDFLKICGSLKSQATAVDN